MAENQSSGARLSHGKTVLVTREQLAALPTVFGTNSFKPVAHIELVVSLENVLANRGIMIRTKDNSDQKLEQFSISQDGMRLFGTMDLVKHGIAGTCASLGFRTANNKTMSLRMVAGLRVFVCDNLTLSGDSIVLSRKHTSGLNLIEELGLAMTKYERQYDKLRTEVAGLQGYKMLDTFAKVLMHDVFAAQVMPVRFFPTVSDVYFNRFMTSEEPKYAAFQPRTAWSLLNAFTEVAKEMPLATRISATQLVGKTFGALVQ